MRFLTDRFLRFLFPPQCHCCETFLEEGEQGVCRGCFSKIRWIEPPFCTICGVPFLSGEIESHPCGACLTRRRYFTIARALGYYEGPFRETIHRWKYEEKNCLTRFFGEKLAEGFRRYWDVESFDLLLPVPLHPCRLRERGFNQALLLVRELNRSTRIPYSKKLLRKKILTPPQVHLSRAEREKAVRGSFDLQREEEVEGKLILLVDDVYTTGSTVNECARVLRKAGAKQIDVLTLAHAIKNF